MLVSARLAISSAPAELECLSFQRQEPTERAARKAHGRRKGAPARKQEKTPEICRDRSFSQTPLSASHRRGEIHAAGASLHYGKGAALTNSSLIPNHEGGIGDARSVIGSEGATQGLTLDVTGESAAQSWFEQHDGPTLLVAAAIYTSWLMLLASRQYFPWWITAPLAGYVVQWHSSLQHEAIHSMRGIPKWLRRALVWPPIGVCFPFELYRRSHAQHHRNRYLTYPGEDTESYYSKEEDWSNHGLLWRCILIVNQTFLGRLIIGPFLRMPRLCIEEISKMFAGDIANAGIWVRHFIGLALILLLVTRVFGMSVWCYVAEFVYTGLVFGMMRSFTEHRWGERPSERTAVVESNWVFGVLFLWNNLHAVHHLFPTLPWWKIPRVWRQHRARIQTHNGDFVFRGYSEIARRWLIRPNFIPIHPPGLGKNLVPDAAVLEPDFATQSRIKLGAHGI